MMSATRRRRMGVGISALALGTLSLAACGSSAADAPASSSASAPAPTDAVPVDPSSPGAEPSASDAVLPEGWFPELPLPASASLVSLNVFPDGKNLNSIWTVEDTAEEAAADYGIRLGKAGLGSLGTIESDGMSSTDYAGAGLAVNVVVTSEGGTTGLLINASRD